MHHVPFIKTRSLSHLPRFCQPKKNSTSYPLESYLVPQPYIQPLRDFHPPFLLPISYFFSHCYHYCLGSYICFFFFNNKTLTKPTQLLPVNLLQHHFHLAQSIFTRLGVLPTLTEWYSSSFMISPQTTFPFVFLIVPENHAQGSMVYSLLTH